MIQYRALGFVLLLLTPLLVRFAIISDYLVRYEYYATVLCENQDKPELSCNGKCAMMQNLQEAEKQNQPQAPAIPKIKVQEMPFDLLHESISFNFMAYRQGHYFASIRVEIPQPWLFALEKPPTDYVSSLLA